MKNISCCWLLNVIYMSKQSLQEKPYTYRSMAFCFQVTAKVKWKRRNLCRCSEWFGSVTSPYLHVHLCEQGRSVERRACKTGFCNWFLNMSECLSNWAVMRVPVTPVHIKEIYVVHPTTNRPLMFCPDLKF